MTGRPKEPRRRHTTFLLREHTAPDQTELQLISNAINAALEYSPLKRAPRHHDDVYAYVARQIEERFWTDIYVDRPEIREILFTLDTGQLVLVTGECGTGKSTAIQAVVHELEPSGERSTRAPADSSRTNFIPCVFDANSFKEALRDEHTVSETIHRELYEDLLAKVKDRLDAPGSEPGAWLSFIYQHHSAFEIFRNTVENDGLSPHEPQEWRYLASQPDYHELIAAGLREFSQSPHADRLRTLLAFIGRRTPYEPLLVIDNVDHLGYDTALRCGEVLFAIMSSSRHRVRGAVAVRPETADAIQHQLDTAMAPARISMTQRPLDPDAYERPPIELTLRFLEKRLAVLREEETIAVMRDAIDREKAARLAESAALTPNGSVGVFLDSIMELLELMVYDIFRTDEQDAELKRDNWEFAHAVHSWHNGSLRECALSLTVFASDILQDKTHMYRLRELLQSMLDSRGERSLARRRKLRRVTRSLLYRHLLFWSAADGEPIRPPENVMVFASQEEATDPPIHFLRLRLLQYLAHRRHGRATVTNIRIDICKLGVEQGRVDEALRELAVKRFEDDAGLIRVDGLYEVGAGERLRDGAVVQLLDAGRFLVDTLYVTNEYLFWSALNTPAAAGAVRLPKEVTSELIQSDAFRTAVATRFLKGHLVEKFCDEHPCMRGFTAQWSPERSRKRLRLYEQLFGFTSGRWFLDRAANSFSGFIPSRDRSELWVESREAVDAVRRLARLLDRVMGSSAGA